MQGFKTDRDNRLAVKSKYSAPCYLKDSFSTAGSQKLAALEFPLTGSRHIYFIGEFPIMAGWLWKDNVRTLHKHDVSIIAKILLVCYNVWFARRKLVFQGKDICCNVLIQLFQWPLPIGKLIIFMLKKEYCIVCRLIVTYFYISSPH